MNNNQHRTWKQLQRYLPQIQPLHVVVEPLHSHFLPVVVLLEVTLQRLGQLQEVDVVVGQTVDDHGPAQVLQGKREVPVQGPGEHGLEKHATTRIFVMFDKATNCVRRVDAGIVRIETELVIPLFYPGVQGAAVLAERHAEEELLLGRVPQEERAFRLAVQQPLGLVAVHLT